MSTQSCLLVKVSIAFLFVASNVCFATNGPRQDTDTPTDDEQPEMVELGTVNRIHLENEVWILKMNSTFEGRNDVYRMMLYDKGPEFFEKQRKKRLLVTAMSSYIYLNLEVSNPPILLSKNYKARIIDTALDALLLMNVKTKEKFLEEVLNHKSTLRLYELDSDRRFAAKIVDPETSKLTAEFSKYLDIVYASEK